MKKLVALALGVAAAASAFSADISFTNEVSSRTFDSWHWEVGDTDYGKTKFAGFSDEVTADYEGDILKVGADAVFTLTPYARTKNSSGEDVTYYSVDWDDVDWYIEFSPWKIVSLGFSDELYTEGSHLFVLDDDIKGGNYSTDGFAVLLRPEVEGLTIGAGVDFPANFDDWLDDDGDDHDVDPALAIGVDYNAEQFSIGGAIHHLTNGDARVIGVYAAIRAVEGLGLHVGFTHSASKVIEGLEDVTYAPSSYGFFDGTKWRDFNTYCGIGGKNVLSASITYSFDPFDFAADFAMNLNSDDSDYDLYSAAEFIFNLDSVVKGLGLDVTGFVLYDLGDAGSDDKLGTTFGVKPQLVYKTGSAQSADEAKHEFRVGVAYQKKFEDDRLKKKSSYWYLSLPVSWKYTY